MARICREAGASVRVNAKLQDMNVAVSANDERTIEVLASGLPLHHGTQVAIDITVRSATTSAGLLATNASHTNGAVLMAARRVKEEKIQGAPGG